MSHNHVESPLLEDNGSRQILVNFVPVVSDRLGDVGEKNNIVQ